MGKYSVKQDHQEHLQNSEVIDVHLYYGDDQIHSGIFSGRLFNGVPHGAGNIRFDNGDEYFGEFIDGVIEGKGVWTEVNGNRYQGSFQGGEKSGFGIMKYTNGDVFEGEWKENRRNGEGKYIYPCGDIFEGHWISDHRNGDGKLIRTDGDVIEGEWIDDHWYDPNKHDPLFNDAARVVVHHQQGSISLVQRKLEIGYMRAFHIINQLEKAGILGSFEGNAMRTVLIKDAPALEELLKNFL